MNRESGLTSFFKGLFFLFSWGVGGQNGTKRQNSSVHLVSSDSSLRSQPSP